MAQKQLAHIAWKKDNPQLAAKFLRASKRLFKKIGSPFLAEVAALTPLISGRNRATL
jgi:hypothetical protein